MTRRQWLAGWCCAAALSYAQEPGRISVPLSANGRARQVRVKLVQNSITVRGYNGKDVIVEAPGRRRDRDRDGLRRIEPPGVEIDEQDAVIAIKTDPQRPRGELVIQVPYEASLQLATVNGGAITVEHVGGEIDANNLNGRIVLEDVSGPVVAHTTNGSMRVSFSRVTTDKPMSFSSLNGTVDVTLPADLRAAVRMKAGNGSIYSDFDVRLAAGVHGGSQMMNGTINGGGVEMQFQTMNGNIYLRKRK